MRSLEPTVRATEAPGADLTRFVYAGIAFDVAPAPGVVFALDADHRRCCAPFEAGPVAASVRVAVSSAPEFDVGQGGRAIWGEWRGSAVELRTACVRAEVREVGRGRFVASALVGADPFVCSSLASALAATILERMGGLVLHAAAVELDGRAVLFVGPSTAGKTTAANLCGGALAFARDRAAIFPTAAGWYASPLAGGSDPVELPTACPGPRPLAAVVRVVQDVRPQVVGCEPVRAVAVLRESTQTVDQSVSAELALLDRLVAASTEVRVGLAYTVLDHRLTDDLREFCWRQR